MSNKAYVNSEGKLVREELLPPETIWQKLKSSTLDIWKKPTTAYVTLAGMFTKFSDMAITCFIPIFFLRTYPQHKTTYAMLNALILAVLGFSSNIIGGIVGDRMEGKNPKFKAHLCKFSNIASCILLPLCFMGHGNFWLSLLTMSMNVLFTGGQASAAITMLQNAVSTEEIGKIIGAYNMFTSLTATVAPIIFGYLATSVYNAKLNPIYYGRLLIGFVLGGYLPAAFLYHIAGKKVE